MPGLYYSERYSGEATDDYDEKFVANTVGMRLGPPRLRQLRSPPSKTAPLLVTCYSAYVMT